MFAQLLFSYSSNNVRASSGHEGVKLPWSRKERGFYLNFFLLKFLPCSLLLGHGKNHKDAASVRATHPIPAACGIYYFEVKIVSKGRDG